ncbi:MAG: sigma-70 family RNA polymerase sigma factor [Planctomycetota bacterium]|nr:MAG: sigma-70 family RNA polymerase sigma factor [Planctomycetota bacterium]
MAKYRHRPIAELTHQLTLSPVRLRPKQLDAAEYLINLIDPAKHYPYDFVVHHITDYRPKGDFPQRPMQGKALIGDLVQLVEDLSATAVLPVHQMSTPCWTTEELATRLKVSTKTICRWRRRGLPGRKLRYPDGTIRMSFLERNVRRFVTQNHELVKRGAAFKQLSDQEKKQIIDLAKAALLERRMKLHELSQVIAAKIGRAVETVRYTIRRYDQMYPQDALFGRDDQPVVKPELQTIYDTVKAGKTYEEAARTFGRTVGAVKEIVREVRARLLKAQEIKFIHNTEFEAPGADEAILNHTCNVETPLKRIRPPKDLPPYLQDLYRQPLLTPEQEQSIFRKYNYLKFKAERLQRETDVMTASDAVLDKLEALLAEVDRVKNEILRANLRLVVSIARRHVGRSPHFFEIVSDGNLSLMRAVEKFDYSRGYKFSTYASWAIMRNYARTIPEQMYQSVKMVTGSEEMLAATPAKEEDTRESVVEAARHMIQKGLGLLTAREREVVVKHYGLEKNESPMTLEQIGGIFGVTKERVRQIERKALKKLREAMGPGTQDLIPETAG